MTISLEETQHIATLARIALDDDELVTMQRELSAIIEIMADLRELDLDGVPATLHATITSCGLREDQPRASLPRREALAGAPRTRDFGFAVPKVMDK